MLLLVCCSYIQRGIQMPFVSSIQGGYICLGPQGSKEKERFYFSFVQILLYSKAHKSLQNHMELNKNQHNALFTSLASKCQLGQTFVGTLLFDSLDVLLLTKHTSLKICRSRKALKIWYREICVGREIWTGYLE